MKVALSGELIQLSPSAELIKTMLFTVHTMGNLSLEIVPLILTKSGRAVLLIVLGITSMCFIYRNKKTMFSIRTDQMENALNCQ